MTKVSTQVARKDYPSAGIKKGDTYYSWTPGFRGRLQRSKTYPRASQLTANDKLSTVYGIDENISDELLKCTCPADVTNLIEQSVSDINEVAEQYRESFENMPEGLQQGDTGQQLESNADELDNWASELEDVQGEVESFEFVQLVNDKLIEDGEPELAEGVEFDVLTPDQQELVMDAIRELVSTGNNCPL